MACEGTYQLGECCDWSIPPEPPVVPPGTDGWVSAKSYHVTLAHYGFSQFYDAFYAGEYDPNTDAWVDGGPSFAKGSVVRRFPKGDIRGRMYIATRAIEWVTLPPPPVPLPEGYVPPADPNDPATVGSGWAVFSTAPRHYFVIPQPGGQAQQGDSIWGSKYLATNWNDYSVYTDRWLSMSFNATFAVEGGGTFGYSYTAKWNPETGTIEAVGGYADTEISLPNGPNGEVPYGPFMASLVLRRYGVENADGWKMNKTTMAAGWQEQWSWYGDKTIGVAVSVSVSLSEPYGLKECFGVACGLLAVKTEVANQVYRQWYGLSMYCRLSNLTVEVERLVVSEASGATVSVFQGGGRVNRIYECSRGARSYFPVWEDMVRSGYSMSWSVSKGVCPP